MNFTERTIRDAPAAFRLLKGCFCVHKPADWGIGRLLSTVKLALCNDLNKLEQRPIQTAVEIVGSLKDEKLEIRQYPSYADNPLTVGPRYQPGDIRMSSISYPPYMSSGVAILVLSPSRKDHFLKSQRLVSTFHLQCQLGVLTEDYTTIGRVIEKTSFKHVNQALVERYLSSVQASFQTQVFEHAGVDLESQEAFELASKGLIRPQEKAMPIVYALRCIEFDAPNFTIEVQVINEDDEYLRRLVGDLAEKLKTAAAVDKMRRIRYGPFTINDTLVKNHWSLENILNNIRETGPLVEQWRYPNLLGAADPYNPNLTLLKKL